MKNEEIRIGFKVASGLGELDAEQRRLVEKAKEMTFKSYAPYSKFCVGAAIELADGQIVAGANQENAAYPSGTCAERSACYYASANHPGETFRRIAIAARNEKGEFQASPISPCGACRQALLEYEHKQGSPIEVILYGETEIYILPSIGSLMPLSFTEF